MHKSSETHNILHGISAEYITLQQTVQITTAALERTNASANQKPGSEFHPSTVKTTYNDIGLCDTSHIA